MSWALCTAGHRHWGRRGAAGLLVARAGTALLQLRADWAHRGGTWSTPGGALERGETPLEAALREAEEELGIDAGALVVRGTRVAVCGGWPYETVLAEPRDPRTHLAVRDLAESAGHAWVPEAEVADLPLLPGFRLAWEDGDRQLRDFVRATA